MVQAVNLLNPVASINPRGLLLARPPVQFSPIQNLLLGQGKALMETLSDPERLSQSLVKLIPGCLPATYTDLAQQVSTYVRGGLEPLVQPV